MTLAMIIVAIIMLLMTLLTSRMLSMVGGWLLADMIFHNHDYFLQPRFEEPGGTEVSYARLSAGHGHRPGSTVDISYT